MGDRNSMPAAEEDEATAADILPMARTAAHYYAQFNDAYSDVSPARALRRDHGANKPPPRPTIVYATVAVEEIMNFDVVNEKFDVKMRLFLFWKADPAETWGKLGVMQAATHPLTKDEKKALEHTFPHVVVFNSVHSEEIAGGEEEVSLWSAPLDGNASGVMYNKEYQLTCHQPFELHMARRPAREAAASAHLGFEEAARSRPVSSAG